MLIISNSKKNIPIIDAKQKLLFEEFIIILDENFKVQLAGDSLFIHYEGVINSGHVPSLTEDEYITRIKSSDFDKIFIKISRGQVSIYSSLYKKADIYYSTNELGYIDISDDVNILAYLNSNYSLSHDFIHEFIHYNPSSIFTHPVSEFRKLTSGCATTLSNGVSSIVDLTDLSPGGNSYFETLSNVIKKAIRNKKTFLHFTGGLDSSLVFHTMKECGSCFEAIYHKSESYDNDSEELKVSAICKKYGVKLHLLKLIDRNQCKEQHFNHPSECAVDNKFYCSDTFDYEDHKGGGSIFLNGQGGDTLFCQNPASDIGRQLILKKKPFTAIKKMHQLSNLKGLSFFRLILEALNHKKYKQNSKHIASEFGKKNSCSFTHPLMQVFKGDLLQKRQLEQLLYETESLPAPLSSGNHFYSPLLSSSSLKSWLTYPYEQNFNSSHDRAIIRQMAFKRFREESFLSIKKRSSVNVIFSEIRAYRELLISAVNDSRIRPLFHMSDESLRNSVEQNLSVRLDENYSSFLRAIQLKIYLTYLESMPKGIN
ncbi:hypothetical protein JHG98_004316 [Salmonella enterica]|nr:hypothetical protein [Salmonella enterica subsp. enterica serovar Panama]EGX9180293.1 hypothetical protein [Salmonella enterica]EGZ6497051.1 hypothetical protein [Salmonella enterica]